MAWLVDLDGVVWLGGLLIPGSAEAVARLRSAGERVVFVTNFSMSRVGEHEAALAAAGIPAVGDVVSSASAAGTLVESGETVLVVGGPGVIDAVEARGARVVNQGPADAVVVGLTWGFDYDRLRAASAAVRAGARLIGTNDDASYPTPDGEWPGAGSLMAAVAYASGATPVYAGKPNQPMADAVLALVGPGSHTMVGDRPSTDGLFARHLGARFALVLSGVTAAADLPVTPEPDIVAPDLAALVTAELTDSDLT